MQADPSSNVPIQIFCKNLILQLRLKLAQFIFLKKNRVCLDCEKRVNLQYIMYLSVIFLPLLSWFAAVQTKNIASELHIYFNVSGWPCLTKAIKTVKVAMKVKNLW